MYKLVFVYMSFLHIVLMIRRSVDEISKKEAVRVPGRNFGMFVHPAV